MPLNESSAKLVEYRPPLGGRPLTFKLSKHQLAMVASALLLRVCLDLAYINFTQPIFAYSGYPLDPDTGYVVVSYLTTVLLGFLLPTDQSQPSTNVAFIYYIIFYVPFGTIFSLMPGAERYFCLVTLAFVIMFVILRWFPATKPLPTVRCGARVFIALAALCVGYTISIFVMRGGLSLVTFDLSKIYDVRGKINNEMLAGFAGYTSTWAAKVFVPGLLVYALWKKRRMLTAISLALFMVLFAVTSAKAVALFPFLILTAYFGQKRGVFRKVFVAAVFGIIGVAWLTWVILGNIVVAAVLLQRALYIPTRECFAYYDFFQSHPLVFWSNSLLSSVISYPYSNAVPNIIGFGEFGPGTETYANAGIFATGYEQFGVVGVLLFPAIAALTLKLMDAVAKNRMPVHVGFALSVIAGLQYHSADLTESLLTHGVFLTWLALFLLGDEPSPDGSRGQETETGATEQSDARVPGAF